jgi:dienelactone hydrolase
MEGKFNLYEVRRLIKETADDIPSLIDNFISEKQVDAARIGMIGMSMGGFTTFRALVIEERITVAAPIIASPYFDEKPKDVPIITRPEITQALKAYSREFSPAHFPDRFYPRAILIQVGRKDQHLDAGRVAQFYQNLTSYYRERPDRLKLIVEEKIGHEFTNSMWSNTINWFKRYL